MPAELPDDASCRQDTTFEADACHCNVNTDTRMWKLTRV